MPGPTQHRPLSGSASPTTWDEPDGARARERRASLRSSSASDPRSRRPSDSRGDRMCASACPRFTRAGKQVRPERPHAGWLCAPRRTSQRATGRHGAAVRLHGVGQTRAKAEASVRPRTRVEHHGGVSGDSGSDDVFRAHHRGLQAIAASSTGAACRNPRRRSDTRTPRIPVYRARRSAGRGLLWYRRRALEPSAQPRHVTCDARIAGGRSRLPTATIRNAAPSLRAGRRLQQHREVLAGVVDVVSASTNGHVHAEFRLHARATSSSPPANRPGRLRCIGAQFRADVGTGRAPRPSRPRWR